MIIAGIGSRDTPLAVQDQMRKIGAYCLANGIRLLSGHADGADWSFECGAQEACTAFLPWRGYNINLVSRAEHVVTPYMPSHEILLEEILVKHHPRPSVLTETAKLLLRRNAYQVLGFDLITPVKAIVCWTYGANAVGGTGHALRIAKAYDIPVINMYKPEISTATSVQLELLKTLSH